MPSKKDTVKRIVIFTVLAYLPVYIMGAVFLKGKGTEMEITSATAGLLLMFFPTIANILTRVTTKEGFRNTYLGTGKKGSGKYYILPSVAIILAGLAGGLLVGTFAQKDWSFSECVMSDGRIFTYGITSGIISGIGIFASGFGEEFGWRAYLTPKLEELMSTPKAVIVTGIIWSFWHAPLIVRGYNFGVEDRFFPYSSLLAMTVFCIAVAAILTWLTKKTGSVYPAAVLHAVLDGINSIIIGMIRYKDIQGEEIFENRYTDFITSCTFMLPTVIMGAVFFVLLFQKKKLKFNDFFMIM